MIAALKQGKWQDKVASSASLLGSSLQIYFVGYIAMYFLVFKMGILDNPSYTPITESPADWFSGLLLPWLVLAIIFTANYTRMSRSQLVEQLSEDYVRTARAKGLSRSNVFLRFAWRGAMGPIVTIFGVDLGTLIGGAIITESVFSLQGVGRLALDAVNKSDLPWCSASPSSPPARSSSSTSSSMPCTPSSTRGSGSPDLRPRPLPLASSPGASP